MARDSYLHTTCIHLPTRHAHPSPHSQGVGEVFAYGKKGSKAWKERMRARAIVGGGKFNEPAEGDADVDGVQGHGVGGGVEEGGAGGGKFRDHAPKAKVAGQGGEKGGIAAPLTSPSLHVHGTEGLEIKLYSFSTHAPFPSFPPQRSPSATPPPPRPPSPLRTTAMIYLRTRALITSHRHPRPSPGAQRTCHPPHRKTRQGCHPHPHRRR